MELVHLTTILPVLPIIAAEPASIIYIVSGAVGLLFARRRTAGQRTTDSSVAMLFCRKQTHDKLSKLKLI
ncbi:MAG TPA: hypothetical protein VK578_09470 [Edaphobacter sp.]|jgi:hypothetical protein|nr:hypothetical protein [Edaphobacter sp.]